MDTTDLLVQQAIIEFKKAEFGNKTNPSYSNQDDVLWAIQRAYQDMQPRTIKGHTSDIKEECCRDFLDKFNDIIEKGLCFEEIHKKLCDAFLNLLNGRLRNKGLVEQKYGKAQKVVNMTFKYLYCFAENDDIIQYLQQAQMPLDSLTLKWYESFSGEHFVWSNLNEADYRHIVGRIKTKLNNKDAKYDDVLLPNQPLMADFIIWAEEKRKKQLKDLKAALKSAASDKGFCRKLSEEDASEIKECCEKVSQFLKNHD